MKKVFVFKWKNIKRSFIIQFFLHIGYYEYFQSFVINFLTVNIFAVWKNSAPDLNSFIPSFIKVEHEVKALAGTE